MTDDWDSLRFFLAVARSESVATAARRLHVSDVTVRRRIAALEASLGATLFDRLDGAYRLTESGAQLAPAAQEMELAVDRAREALLGADRNLVGRVRVGAPDAIGTICLAPVFSDLRRRHPELSIELISLTQPTDLNRREVDVAVTWERPHSGPHRVRTLRPAPLRLYAAAGYLADRPPITAVEDLSDQAFVGYFDRSYIAAVVAQRMKEAGVSLTPAFASSNIMAQARAAATGAGIVLLPSYVAEPHLGLVPVLHDAVCVTFPLWLLVHAEMAQLARVKAVAAAIATTFQKGFDGASRA